MLLQLVGEHTCTQDKACQVPSCKATDERGSAARHSPSMGLHLNDFAILFQACVTCVFCWDDTERGLPSVEPRRCMCSSPVVREFYLIPRLDETQRSLSTQVSGLDDVGLLPGQRLVLEQIKRQRIIFNQSMTYDGSSEHPQRCLCVLVCVLLCVCVPWSLRQ